MSRRTQGAVFGFIAFFLSGLALSIFTHPSASSEAQLMHSGSATPETLITEPDAGIAPITSLIESASRSIDLVIYELNDTQIESLLAARAKAGIAVRVILDKGYYGAQSNANVAAFNYLQSHGVAVQWSPAYFALTHQKTLVIDNREALIMTFNLTPKYYKDDRDFGILDTDQSDVSSVEGAFDSDWNDQNIAASNGDDLVWSPGSESALIDLINGAQQSLDIYNEEMADAHVITALENAAKRGVEVDVDMTYASEWASAFAKLTAAGVQVRTYDTNAPLYIHAKVIIADGARAFVGSENFSSNSLNKNRELGILVSNPNMIQSLSQTFQNDWQQATPFVSQ